MVESSNQPDSLDANIAFRLTAIRETFEESGVFLAQYHSTTPTDAGAMSEWCGQVRKDPTNFFKMCQQLNASPGVIYTYVLYVFTFFLAFLSICKFVEPWDW